MKREQIAKRIRTFIKACGQAEYQPYVLKYGLSAEPLQTADADLEAWYVSDANAVHKLALQKQTTNLRNNLRRETNHQVGTFARALRRILRKMSPTQLSAMGLQTLYRTVQAVASNQPVEQTGGAAQNNGVGGGHTPSETSETGHDAGSSQQPGQGQGESQNPEAPEDHNVSGGVKKAHLRSTEDSAIIKRFKTLFLNLAKVDIPILEELAKCSFTAERITELGNLFASYEAAVYEQIAKSNQWHAEVALAEKNWSHIYEWFTLHSDMVRREINYQKPKIQSQLLTNASL